MQLSVLVIHPRSHGHKFVVSHIPNVGWDCLTGDIRHPSQKATSLPSSVW